MPLVAVSIGCRGTVNYLVFEWVQRACRSRWAVARSQGTLILVDCPESLPRGAVFFAVNLIDGLGGGVVNVGLPGSLRDAVSQSMDQVQELLALLILDLHVFLPHIMPLKININLGLSPEKALNKKLNDRSGTQNYNFSQI